MIDVDDFLIVDDNFNFLETNSPISSIISNMSFSIMRFCLFDCPEEIDNNTNFAYYLTISYSGYKIDHQNTDTPLEMRLPPSKGVKLPCSSRVPSSNTNSTFVVSNLTCPP